MIGPARKVYRSLDSWCLSHIDACQTSRVLRIKHSSDCALEYKVVVAIPRLPVGFEKGNYSPPPLYVAELSGARVVSRQCEVISSDDGVFSDLFFSSEDRNLFAYSLIMPYLGPLRRKEGVFLTICTERAINYYHWLNDCLTRLWLLHKLKVDYTSMHIILPENIKAFHLESLEVLGFKRSHIHLIGKEQWEVERLVVPSLVNRAGFTCVEAATWLAEEIKNRVMGTNRPRAWRRVFVSRSLASKRKLLNEEELFLNLKHRGFEKVCAETLSFEQQVRLFSEAEVVLGPHGAGLANIMFMEQGGLVIELVPYRKPKPHYLNMAAAFGLRYACITDEVFPSNHGSPSEREQEERPMRRIPDMDFSIPIERVEEVLDRLGIY